MKLARVEALLAQADELDDADLLRLHREVCRRAARVYEPMYRASRERNWRAAMSVRDTRFQPGLSPIENVMRSMQPRGDG